MLSRIRRFIYKEDGVASLEFALVLPILMALLLGSVEFTRYHIAALKAEKAAVTMSDLVAQSEDVGTSDLNILVQAVGEVMQPFVFSSDGYVIVSSVSRTGSSSPVINWQYTNGSWIQTSQVGSQGGSATLPANFSLDPNEGIIIAEVYFRYTPMIANGILPVSTMYKIGVYKPRLGELTTLGS